MEKLFFIDAEADGLYGGFISAAIVITTANCLELERYYYGICQENLQVQEPWVRENVLPVMGCYTPCEDEEELLERVWALWEKHRENAYAVGDVIYPVEARLFSECVRRDRHKRASLAPFPLLDLSAMLYAKGISPLEERRKLAGDAGPGRRHNALEDVLMSIAVYKRISERVREPHHGCKDEIHIETGFADDTLSGKDSRRSPQGFGSETET